MENKWKWLLCVQASTNFSRTKNLEIKGKFSTEPNSQVNNVLIAMEDAFGQFDISIFHDQR